MTITHTDWQITEMKAADIETLKDLMTIQIAHLNISKLLTYKHPNSPLIRHLNKSHLLR